MIPEAAENRKEFADCETGAEFTVEKYKNTSLSPRERAEDLPGRMSLEKRWGRYILLQVRLPLFAKAICSFIFLFVFLLPFSDC